MSFKFPSALLRASWILQGLYLTYKKHAHKFMCNDGHFSIIYNKTDIQREACFIWNISKNVMVNNLSPTNKLLYYLEG